MPSDATIAAFLADSLDTTWVLHEPPTDMLQQFLDDLCATSADGVGALDRHRIYRAAVDAGYEGAYVVCDRHGTGAMTLEQFLFNHLLATEKAWRRAHTCDDGENCSTHRNGSARGAYDGESVPARIAASNRRRRVSA